MWYKLMMSIRKEFLLLFRDVGGIVILFVMPIILLITITMVQKTSYDSITGTRVKILFVDNDKGEISKTVRNEIDSIDVFELVETLDNKALDENMAKEAVSRGDYQLAVVLPQDLSTDLAEHIKQNVDKILVEFDYSQDSIIPALTPIEPKEINLYFDPATQGAFKSAIKNTIDKLIATVENKQIYATFQKELGVESGEVFSKQNFIRFKDIAPQEEGKEIIPNAVQHNVPAWALFAIFFIIVPLSINIVKEKSQGTMVRLITNPVPYSFFLISKTITYSIISGIQFYLMLLVGVFVFPVLGLPQFVVGDNFILLSLMAFFSGLAAIGLGIVIGTLCSTQEQSAPFGATFVVILAALGGVWVPVFIMPPIMQKLSVLSPMNWGLNGFYDIVLRKGGLLDIAPEIILLFLFFGLTLLIAILYDKKKRTI
ncbi:ABC transporter permease [Sphingobacterium hungaricum]|nr:ABC transporter permease [Sphingobacterium hungaricum]